MTRPLRLLQLHIGPVPMDTASPAVSVTRTYVQPHLNLIGFSLRADLLCRSVCRKAGQCELVQTVPIRTLRMSNASCSKTTNGISPLESVLPNRRSMRSMWLPLCSGQQECRARGRINMTRLD